MEGWSSGQTPRRWASPKTTEERFWPHVEKTDYCWNWTASRKGRYGQFLMRNAAGKWYPETAHRVSYRLAYGKIPRGWEVDHLCLNTLCVRPGHLEAVTPTENRRRQAQPRVGESGRFRGRR